MERNLEWYCTLESAFAAPAPTAATRPGLVLPGLGVHEEPGSLRYEATRAATPTNGTPRLQRRRNTAGRRRSLLRRWRAIRYGHRLRRCDAALVRASGVTARQR